MSSTVSHWNRTLRVVLMGSALGVLAACEAGQTPGFLKPKNESETVSRAGSGGARATERDVEAPDIFQATEAGLWDGRPSLGGVWVAHPDVAEPERAIIRNTANGKFVIGALFRKERQTPGPRLQVSSDAAAALGMLAGATSNLDVVALRREEVVEEPQNAALDSTELAAAAAIPAASDVSEGTLDPVVDGAARALDSAAPIEAAAISAPAPKPSGGLSKPYIQIGIFSVEQNAKNTATAMRQAGMLPTIKPGSSSGKPFWRVVVGPAQTKAERATILKTIKGNGFEDAYPVSN